MRPHIAVIDPASRVAELDSFNRLQQQSNSWMSYHLPCIYGIDSLKDLEAPIDAMIIMGSGASVYDDLPWQETFNSWLRPYLKKDVPILGLCYGHQLLAYLLGAKIGFYREDQHKLVGMREINLKSTNEIWGDIKKGNFVVSHRELITELPDDCHIIASSPEVEVDGFAHNSKPIFGMQCHPEAGPGFIKNQSLPVDLDESVYASGLVFLSKFIKWVEKKHKTE